MVCEHDISFLNVSSSGTEKSLERMIGESLPVYFNVVLLQFFLNLFDFLRALNEYFVYLNNSMSLVPKMIIIFLNVTSKCSSLCMFAVPIDMHKDLWAKKEVGGTYRNFFLTDILEPLFLHPPNVPAQTTVLTRTRECRSPSTIRKLHNSVLLIRLTKEGTEGGRGG